MGRPATKMDVPHMHPYICAACRVGNQPESTRKYFIDTGIDAEWEGVIYFCNYCLEVLCKASNEFFTREEVNELINVNNDLVSRSLNIINHRETMYTWAKEEFGLDLQDMENKYNESRNARRDSDTPIGFITNSGGTDKPAVSETRSVNPLISLIDI